MKKIFNKSFNEVLFYGFSKVFPGILKFTTKILLARFLGVNLYGIFSYVENLTQIINPLGSFGGNAIVAKDLANNKLNNQIIIFNALVTYIFFSTIIYTIFIIFINTIDLPVYIKFLSIVGGFSIFLNFHILLEKVLINSTNTIKILQASILCSILSFFIKLILIWLDVNILLFIIMFSVEAFLYLTLIIIFSRLNISIFLKLSNLSLKYIFSLLKRSYLVLLSTFVIALYSRVDIIMIQAILDDNSQVSFYSVAQNFLTIWGLIPASLASIYLPVLVKNLKIDKSKFSYMASNLFNILIIVALVISLTLFFFGDKIITLFLGNDFNESAKVLKILIFSTFFIFCGILSSQIAIIFDFQKFIFLNLSLGLILNIILNYYFIPFFGIYGAAYSTIITQGCASIIFLLIWPKTRMIFNLIFLNLFSNPFRFILNTKNNV